MVPPGQFAHHVFDVHVNTNATISKAFFMSEVPFIISINTDKSMLSTPNGNIINLGRYTYTTLYFYATNPSLSRQYLWWEISGETEGHGTVNVQTYDPEATMREVDTLRMRARMEPEQVRGIETEEVVSSAQVSVNPPSRDGRVNSFIETLEGDK